MKSFYINFFSIIVFTIIISILNFKHSGGDIFIQFMIVCFIVLTLIVSGLIRCFISFDFFKCFLGVLSGALVSYVIFLVFNYLAVKHS